MASKQGKRRLPAWYLDKVNLAANVYQGAPQGVSTGMPFVALWGGGQGVTTQRTDRMCTKHSGMHQGMPVVKHELGGQG